MQVSLQSREKETDNRTGTEEPVYVYVCPSYILKGRNFSCVGQIMHIHFLIFRKTPFNTFNRNYVVLIVGLDRKQQKSPLTHIWISPKTQGQSYFESQKSLSS